MCGINGFVTRRKVDYEILNQEINGLNDLIVHRGPDSDGVYIEQNEEFSVVMGMRRLSIIDLHSGDQPIFSEDKKLVIVFNGEIYNYKSLREELESNGLQFDTESDTEVVLKLYESEGEKSFRKLDGMYAFSIYDRTKEKIFLARDYFGEKPLYYSLIDGEFIYGSELKAVLKHQRTNPKICSTGFNLYFRLTYIPAPFTIYDGIFKLEPNHYLAFDVSAGTYDISIIDDFVIPKRKKNISFEAAKEEVKSMIYKSVLSRSIADVPLGTFLSGGVDSSIVSLCLSQQSSIPIETFSIGFEKKSFDETDKSRTVANLIQSNHHEFIIGEKDLYENVNQILLNFDEPFADSSSLPTFIVANKTRQYVKVALTGDGGDEVFGGYNKYYVSQLNDRYTRVIPQRIHASIGKILSPLLKTSNDDRGLRFKIKRLLNSINYNDKYYWDIISLGFVSDEVPNFINSSYFQTSLFKHYEDKSGIKAPITLTDFRRIDRMLSLEGDMLVKVDRTSMLNSLECRAPFLSKEIWSYTSSLPEKYLLNRWNKKYILKEAFKDQFPKGFLEKGKSGFGVPVGDWLKSSLKQELMSYIEVDKLKEQNIFKTDEIIKLVVDHINGKVDNTFKVWTFYCFQKWYFTSFLGAK